MTEGEEDKQINVMMMAAWLTSANAPEPPWILSQEPCELSGCEARRVAGFHECPKHLGEGSEARIMSRRHNEGTAVMSTPDVMESDQDRQAWDEDEADMARIAREWDEYDRDPPGS